MALFYLLLGYKTHADRRDSRGAGHSWRLMIVLIQVPQRRGITNRGMMTVLLVKFMSTVALNAFEVNDAVVSWSWCRSRGVPGYTAEGGGGSSNHQ